ncbi:hypothetical protein AB0M39_20175 [Streptomyces sp. NPDC051907]|uniref:hypothetical protein n=1 Tax=Streptomyces sp. NPDC051907 TaxID=3155284 RepID=UPI003424EBC0
MRQLSVPLSVPGRRLALGVVASLAVMASAGCMSVGDDEGKKPAPRSSADRRGVLEEADGGQSGQGVGRQARTSGHGSDKPGKKGGKDAKGSASPSASAPAKAKPTGGGPRPQTPDPTPTNEGPPPSVQPSEPEPTPSEPPPVSPTPQPSEPTDPPSASSAPEVHAGALRLVDGQSRQGVEAEPTASPQVSPA